MTWDEHIMLIAHTVNKYGNKLLVIGNTGSNSTREALHATEQGFAVGMHAALSINPYYGKTSKASTTHLLALGVQPTERDPLSFVIRRDNTPFPAKSSGAMPSSVTHMKSSTCQQSACSCHAQGPSRAAVTDRALLRRRRVSLRI